MNRINIHSARKSSEESDLIQQINEHPEKFGEIYGIYVQRVFRYIFNRVGNQKDAEDITSQVFISALESFHRYKDRGYLAAWLFTIARRKTIDHYRRNHPYSALDEDTFAILDECMDTRIIKLERQKELKEMLINLSEQEKN